MNKIRPSVGYRDLRSFQSATLLYDATYWFCERWVAPHSHIFDSMIQSARSGRQYIAKCSRASAIPSKTELRQIHLARACFEELLLDYEDFLRHRHLAQWTPDSPEALSVRQVGMQMSDPSNLTDLQRHALYARWLDHPEPALCVNTLIILIHQMNLLLDQQIATWEAQFVDDAGRSAPLENTPPPPPGPLPNPNQPVPPAPSARIPLCPTCGKPMVLRTAQKGKTAGKQFWGCSGYPDCKGLMKA